MENSSQADITSETTSINARLAYIDFKLFLQGVLVGLILKMRLELQKQPLPEFLLNTLNVGQTTKLKKRIRLSGNPSSH